LKKVIWLLQWILKAAIFFTLFAFALNNQEDAVVRLFFGTEWRAPMVLIVLAVFALGVAVGALAMVPRWWRQRKLANQSIKTAEQIVQPIAPIQSTPPKNDYPYGP
jgi:putative membrane protein